MLLNKFLSELNLLVLRISILRSTPFSLGLRVILLLIIPADNTHSVHILTYIGTEHFACREHDLTDMGLRNTVGKLRPPNPK